MAFTPRTIAVAGSAALGAYTSDITDNPLTGLLSTGIAAAIGSQLILPKSDYKDMLKTPVRTRIDYSTVMDHVNSYASTQVDELTGLQKSVGKKAEPFLDLLEKQQKQVGPLPEKQTKALQNYAKNLEIIESIVSKSGQRIDTSSPQKLVESISKINDPVLLKRVTGLLDTKERASFVGGTLQDTRTRETVHNIPSNLDNNTKIQKLSEIFEKQMGNSVEEAQAKAKLFVERSVGNIKIVDGSIVLNDKNDRGRSVSIPLSSYDQNGTRYHNAGGGKAYSVKGFSPYLQSAAGQVGFTDKNGVTQVASLDMLYKGMSPEMMLEHLGDDRPLRELLPNIKSHLAYNAKGVGPEKFTAGFTATDPNFINHSNTLNVGQVFNLLNNGEINPNKPYRTVNTRATERGSSSEIVTYRSQLAAMDTAFAGNQLGLSNSSSLTDIQTNKNLNTLSMFATLERNLSGSYLRDTLPVNPNLETRVVQDFLGKDNYLYKSTQVIGKIDVLDEAAFNRAMVNLTQNSGNILADGFGLASTSDDFAVKQQGHFKIPVSPDMVIENSELAKAFASGNVGEYVRQNPITIGNLETIAQDSQGRPIKLGKQFSSAVITNAYINGKSNELVIEADKIFNARETERQFKYFSPSSKALANQITSFHDVAVPMANMINQGAITVSEDGTSYTPATYKDAKGINRYVSPDLAREMIKYSPNNSTDTLGFEDMARMLHNSVAIENMYGDKNINLILSADNTKMSKVIKTLNTADISTVTQELSLPSKVDDAIKKPMILAGLMTQEIRPSDDLVTKVLTDLVAPLQRIKEGNGTTADYQKAIMYQREKLVSPQGKKGKVTTAKGAIKGNIDTMIQEASSAFRMTLDRGRYYKATNSVTQATRDAAMTRLANVIHMSGSASDIAKGKITTIGTTGLGNSIVGHDNAARMSWEAYEQLRLSGLTREELALFGSVNQSQVYEVEGIIGETRNSTNSINSFIKGRETQASFLLGNATPEERLARLDTEFGLSGYKSPYLTYELNYKGKEIKQLNFSMMSSARSGKFSLEEQDMLKQLDKHRLAIMDADIAYSQDKTNKAFKAELEFRIDMYQNTQRELFKGRLFKDTISLYSDTSAIKVANPVGGDALKYIESIERGALEAFTNADGTVEMRKPYKALANNVFAANEGTENFARTLGIHKSELIREAILDENGNKTTLSRVGYNDANGKFVPLVATTTRSPAQGHLSTQMLEIIEDSRLRGNAFHFAQGQGGYKIGFTGDFDQDTVQVLGRRLNREEYEGLSAKFEAIRNAHAPYLNLEDDMSPKGAGTKTYGLGSFEGERGLGDYMALSAEKGNIRKAYAADATTLAEHYTRSVVAEFGQNADDIVLGRIASYRTVENLLKSSHLDTMDFNEAKPVEELSLARQQFLKDGDKKVYGSALDKYLPQVLGYSTTAKGRVGFQGLDHQAEIKRVSSMIRDAELNQAVSLSRSAHTVNTIDKRGTLKQIGDSYLEAVQAQDMFDVETGMDIKRSPSQLYNGISDDIVEGLRKNKAMLAVGAAALIGVNLLGREQPSFSDSRSQVIQPSQKMIQPHRDVDQVADLGIETNPTRAAYITPNSYSSSKAVNMSGQFIDDTMYRYDQFNSSLDPTNDIHASNINNAIFGGGLRSARLDTTDF